jgi:DNA repair exonuclease SbcCD nuclease subunit
LGYRTYDRTAGKGVNLREADVAKAFRETIDKTLAIQPAAVLIAGDLFHNVRPPNATVVFAFNEIKRLSDAQIRTVIIGGNHDSPRTIQTGNILQLFSSLPWVHVRYNEPDWIAPVVTDPKSVAVLCVSHNGLLMHPKLKIPPAGVADHHILLVHAAHEKYKLFARSGSGAHVIHSDDIKPDDWDYVALGDYHGYQAIEPNMIYPGAIERTSNNIWAEADEPKGFVVFDLESKEHEFVVLASPRPVVSLGPYVGADMSPEELNAFIECEIEQSAGGIKDKIVRLQLLDVTLAVQQELDYKKINRYKSQAVHFHLDIRRPPTTRTRNDPEARGERVTLEEELERFIRARGHSKEYADDLVKLGLKFLGEIDEDEWKIQ